MVIRDLAIAFDRLSLMIYRPINMMLIQIRYSKDDDNDSMNKLLCIVAIESAIRSALEMFIPNLKGMI